MFRQEGSINNNDTSRVAAGGLHSKSFVLYIATVVKKKKDQLLRALSVGKHNSTRVDEGRKS